MRYEIFTESQKSLYWDTYHEGERLIDSRTLGEWLIEYRRYLRPNGEEINDYCVFLGGNFLKRLSPKALLDLFTILKEFR